MPDGRGLPDGRVTVVVPVFNAITFLPRTVPALLAAARRTGGVEVRFVDNGSTDGSAEYLASFAADDVHVLRFERKSIGGVRNFGARNAHSTYLSFIDADCGISEGYFDNAIGVLDATRAAATGCEAHMPLHPHWIEETWHLMHYVGRDRDVHYLNSANFFITRDAFERVGGFREDLRTGEDAEIGQRIVDAGFRIRESTTVEAIHFGNPKSLRDFYRRTLWHGLGMFGTVNTRRLDKPTAMMALHLGATLVGLVGLVVAPWSFPTRLLVAVALQCVAPALTVAHRIGQTERLPRLDRALILYWLYYLARLHALLIILTGRVDRYWK